MTNRARKTLPYHIPSLSLLIPLILLTANCGNTDSDNSQPQGVAEFRKSTTTSPVSESSTTAAKTYSQSTSDSATTITGIPPTPTTAITQNATTSTAEPLSEATTSTTATPTTTAKPPTTTTTLHSTTTTPPITQPSTASTVNTTSTTPPSNDPIALVASNDRSCALRQSGTIFCWGDDQFGGLGNGQEERLGFSSVPVQVLGITDATAVSIGYASCALHQNGTISCWGDNYFGQLGDGQGGEDRFSLTPVKVVGISDATAIATSVNSSCAVHQNGKISCWGLNELGQLGNGTAISSSVPVQVLGITDATAVSTGESHSCALHQNGTISCWGHNNFGQLGNGQSTGDPQDFSSASPVPVKVIGISDATAISAGTPTCALHQTGTISCWGGGYLGNGTGGTLHDHSPVPMKVMDITDATAVSIGVGHSCALHQNGTISCWGDNIFGQLGNRQSGDEANSPVPVHVLGITDATAIATGWFYSCALQRNGAISCWGNNAFGHLGNGKHTSGPVNNNDSLAPVKVKGFGG